MQDDSCSDDSDFDDQIMKRLVSAARRAHFVQRQERKRSPSAGPSEALGVNSSMHVSEVQTTLTTSSSGGSLPASGVPSTVSIQPPALNTTPESARRPNTSEISFPESFKSKFSAASAR